MSATPPGPRDLGEILLPLDGEASEAPEPPPAAPSVPAQPPPPRPSGRRTRPRSDPPLLPSPESYAAEVLRHLRPGQAEVTETLAANVDLVSRRLQADVTRLSEASSQASTEMRDAAQAIESSVTALVEMIRKGLAELRETWKEQTESLAASTREAASNIGVARHELALSVKELKRRTVRYAVVVGGTTSVVVLLAARLLFPFWGMKRSDVEAWSRGTELTRTWQAASPAERQAILRALGWERMPGTDAPPAPRSGSSASPADGR